MWVYEKGRTPINLDYVSRIVSEKEIKDGKTKFDIRFDFQGDVTNWSKWRYKTEKERDDAVEQMMKATGAIEIEEDVLKIN